MDASKMATFFWSTFVAPTSEVVQWAVQLIRTRVQSFERLRCGASRKWKHGKRIHRLRTQARRLRAALEDLCDCTPCASGLLSKCRELSDETAAARDTLVMMQRLEGYRRFAMPAERAEIKKLCADLKKEHRLGLKRARAAIKDCRLEMQP